MTERIAGDTELGVRLDGGGRWHTVAAAPCEDCGCPYDFSLDTPGLVWEAGSNIEPECLDDMCDCHITPARGQVFVLHLASSVAS
jgi:hypothetical protein